jgi:hypothetical protein
MDGTEGVTQCPVLPGDTFKYEFKVDRVGIRAAAIGSWFSIFVCSYECRSFSIYVLVMGRLGLICTTLTMECKEKQGFMDQSVYRFLMERQNRLHMIMIGASSSTIGTTKALMNKPLDCPPFLLSGLGSLR